MIISFLCTFALAILLLCVPAPLEAAEAPLAFVDAAAQRMVRTRFGIERMLGDTLDKYDQVSGLQPAT